MNKHEQLVRQIAEEMAESDVKTKYALSQYRLKGKTKDFKDKWYNLSIGVKVTDARIAVKHMADAFRQGWACGKNIDERPENTHWIEPSQLRGLIPPPEGFHCNNKGLHFSDLGYKDVCATQCEACKNYVS